MSLLDELNDRQREAVETTDGPLLILAGAGSGKTRVITYRIAYLIESRGQRPGSLLAVTFTNKAAAEMRERISRLVPLGGSESPFGYSASRPWISTFHSFCVRVLRENGPKIGLPREFSIYDEDDQLRVVKAGIRHLGLTEREFPARAVLSKISHAKNHGRNPETVFRAAADPISERTAVVYDMYTRELKRANAVDFDDLLLETVRLFREDAETALRYNERYRYLLVDEYQDTNRPQYDLVRLLTQTHQNLCAVGDEDQSIYSWRGADIRNIVEFEKDYPAARILRLEQNYRSTQYILSAASALVSHNRMRKGKTLWTDRKGGAKVGEYEAPDGENESLFIADWIAKSQREQPDRRIAVLYRTNAQSRLYEEALRRYGLKYNVIGGISFYERAEVKDLLAYLKAAINPLDSISVLRIINSPPRGIGATTLKKLQEIALEQNLTFWDALGQAIENNLFPARATAALAQFRLLLEDLRGMASQASASTLLSAVMERTKYTEAFEKEGSPEAYGRIENMQELLNAAADSQERGETVAEFLDHAALASDTDSYEEDSPITLMTLHMAKGLEFPVVILGGLEEGLLPHSRSLLNTQMLEEERRLCYVGMTRARDVLILTRARARRHYGSYALEPSAPSRFWNEIPAELVENWSEPVPERRERVYEYEPAEISRSSLDPSSTRNIRSYFGLAKSEPEPQPEPQDEAEARPAAAMLRPGSRVRHAKYGYGTVLRREGSGDQAKLTVSFTNVGVKKLIERYAGLERV